MRKAFWAIPFLGLTLGLGLIFWSHGPAARSDSPAATAAAKENASHSQFGMNLSRVVDWSREWPLVDVFKASRPWMLHGDGKLALDERGNPLLKRGQSVETLMVREIDGHYPEGVYTVTWKGSGTVNVSRWDVRKVVTEGQGRITVDVKPDNGGLQLEAAAGETADAIHDVHVWMPGFEKAKSPFHPLYLKRLAPFGVLRFMDWQMTNGSPIHSWADRAKLDDARYSTEAGVPLELMIDLANTCKADPWFCMPHTADDDYVRRFAVLVKERLDPDRRIYVEYSNEVWNWSFPQTRYADEQGNQLKLGDPPGLRYYSQRSVEIFHIWEEVFGGKERLVRILATQFANPWAGEQVLTWKEAYKHADALAVAPYFGYQFGDPKTAAASARMSPQKLLEALQVEVDGTNRDTIRKSAALAVKYRLKLVAYEGGQHLVGFGGAENNQTLTDLFVATNRLPGMSELYRKHIDHWRAAGGGLYVAFSFVGKPSKWGSWGMLEYQDQESDKAPKYRALIDFIGRPEPAKP